MGKLIKKIRNIVTWAMVVFMLPWSSFVSDTMVYAEDETEITQIQDDQEISEDYYLSSGTLDLNGHTITVNGNFIQERGKLCLNGGTLIVNGDYRIQKIGTENQESDEITYTSADAQIEMTNPEDHIYIANDFVVDNIADTTSMMTNGAIEILGDVTIDNSNGNYGFMPSDSFEIWLTGTETQNVEFKGEYTKDSSHLHNLKITNTSEEGVIFSTPVIISGLFSKRESNVTGDLYLQGDVSFEEEEYGGNITLLKQAAIKSNLLINGNLTVENFAVDYPLEITKNLNICGHINVNDELKVGGDLSFSGYSGIYAYANIFVNGSISSGSYINLISGNLEIGNDINETNVSVNSNTAYVHGNINNSSIDNSNGTLILSGDMSYKGTKKIKDLVLDGERLQRITNSGNMKIETLTVNNTSSEGIIFDDVPNIGTIINNGCNITYEGAEDGRYGWTLEADEVIDDDLYVIGGKMDLNGHSLTVKGDFIHSAGELNINKGILNVEGDYRAQKKYINSESGLNEYKNSLGTLIMINEEDSINIQGNCYIWTSSYGNDALGNVTSYEYNTAGELTAAIYADGTKTIYEYDMAGNMVKQISPSGSETLYEYDSVGNNTKVTYPDGSFELYVYDKHGNVIKEIDRKGNIYTYEINSTYEKTGSIKDNYGNTADYTYDSKGRVNSVKIFDQKEESYTYDNEDKIKSITDESGNVTTYDYNTWGELVTSKDANGNKTIYNYDAAGNCIEKITPEGLDIVYTYDQNYNVIKASTKVQGKEVSESYTYDSMGNTLSYTDSMGRTTKYTYDALNRLTSETTPDGITATYVYNSVGEVIRISYSDGRIINAEYDKIGNVISVTTNSSSMNEENKEKVYSYTYDKMNRLVSTKDPMGYETSQAYDNLDNVISITDAMGGITTYLYDEGSRLIGTKDSLGHSKTFEYDALGRVIKETNARGQETLFTYDEKGRISTLTDETGVTTYTYDNLGNQLTVTDNSGTVKREYDRFNRVISVTDSNGKIIKYSYDELGNILSLTYPGGEIVRYEYNPDASLSSVIDGKGRKTTYEYDRAGRISKITKPDGTTDEKTYDASGNLSKEVQKKQNGDLLLSYEYMYDSLGNIISVKDNIGLDKVDYSVEALSDKGDVDELSSRTTTSVMEYDECNRLISFNGQKVTYDADGNMTYGPLDGKMTEFVYDCRNRLIKAGDISYTYDADNIRTGVITPEYEETYVVDRVNSPTETLQIIRKSPEETETYNYYYGLGFLYSSSDDGVSVYHFDHNGSTRKITDETGNLIYTVQYGTYGEILSIRDVLKDMDISVKELNRFTINRFLYNGECGVVTDDNTLMYMRQRYYNSEIKRFINLDVLTGDVTISQSLNRYAYVQGNPINYSDPFGLSPKEILTDAAKVASQVVHSELNLMGIIPGVAGSVACLLNTVLYLKEGNNFMAGVSAVQAGATLFGGRLISSAVGYFCKFGTGARIALSVGMTGGGAFLTLASYSNLLTDLNNYTSAVKNGADVSTQFTYLSKIIIDAAGVYYGAVTMAGGVNGLTSQCFVEGTTIKTENGDTNIEEIEEGDYIWSFDPGTGETGLKKVKEVFVNETKELEHITLSQYELDNEEVKIECTPEHPFYVVDYGFKYASELKFGDKIKSISGDIYEVKEIYEDVLSKPIKVYNFEVEDWHTYYVTENGIPVHNMCAMNSENTTQTSTTSGSSEGGSGSDIDRIKKVAQQSYDYAVNNPRQSGMNRMQLGKDAEVQATRWTRKWAERNGIDLSEEGLHFQVRGNHSIPDVVYEPPHSIMDFKLTPKAIRKVQSDNFKLDFPDYSIEYIFGPGPWRDN